MASTDTVKSNPRGIPQAPFVEKVEEYVSTYDEVDPTLKKFQETVAKYKFMEVNVLRRANGLREKVPDIEKTLEMVKFIESKNKTSESFGTNFELNDTLFAKATIEPTDTVYLWLGANVMLSYPIPEAIELLTSKLSTAKESLAQCEEDAEYLREQITVMEVNVARIYNEGVRLRRQQDQEK
ncbi:hypothetical protein YB2330_000268 [Saitoella coloradoensis]